MTNATEMIQAETKRRTDLVYNESFRADCAKLAEKVGITAEEWNANKAMICMMFANEVCKIENQN